MNGRVASLNFGPDHFSQSFGRRRLRPSPYHEYEFVNEPQPNYKISYIPPNGVNPSQVQFLKSPYIDANSQYQGSTQAAPAAPAVDPAAAAKAIAGVSLAGAEMPVTKNPGSDYITPNGTHINVPPGYHVRGPPFENGIGLMGGAFDDKNNPVLVNSTTGNVINASDSEKGFTNFNAGLISGVKSIGPALGGFAGGFLGSFGGPFGTVIGTAAGEAVATTAIDDQSQDYKQPTYK